MNMATEANAQFQKARELYNDGKIRQSSSWLRKASANGHKEATRILLMDYQHGRDVQKNKWIALRYMKRAAGMGDIDAAWSICHFYWDHRWIPGSSRKELKYLKLIADSEADEEHYDFIMETAKLVAIMVNENEEESLHYKEIYETMKREGAS